MSMRNLAFALAFVGLTTACMGDRVSDAQLAANEAKAKADATDSQILDPDSADAVVDAVGDVADVHGSDAVEQDLVDAVEGDLGDADADSGPPPCKSPSDCPDPLDLCISGTCQPQTPCKSDKQCSDLGHVCDQAKGVCVECQVDGDCDDGQTCKAQVCIGPAVACTATKDCSSGQVCDKTAGFCVLCIDDNDCEDGQFCTETVCKPDACTANETACVDAAIRKVCAANGAAWTEAKCGDGLSCIDGECSKVICTSGVKQCADGENGIVTCNPNGTAWSVPAPCPSDATCKDANCQKHVCVPNTKKCNTQGGLTVCAADGLSEVAEACPATSDGKGQSCVTEAGKAVCKAQACVPGAAYCDALKAMTCTGDGLSANLKADCSLPGAGGKAQLCLDGGCVAAACKTGDKMCADVSTLATCNAAGNGYDKVACGEGKACENAVCVALVCVAGQLGCDGQKAVKCNTAGTASALVEDCAVKGKVCANGGCASKVCTAGQVQCQGAAVGTCKATLNGWDLKACVTGEVCASGKCTAKVCEPGAIECLGKTIRACNGNGSAWVMVQDCATTNQACLDGLCVAVTCKPGEVTCSGDKLATCKDDGAGYTEVSCDDGNACTQGDGCAAGACKPGAYSCPCAVASEAKDCDDGNSCTLDKCVAAGGLFKCESSAQVNAACSDGDACTPTDTCNAAGACVAGTAKTCGANATCGKGDGKCKCDTGFVGDGQTCKCGPQMVTVDVDGKTVCAPDYPAWGIRPESPPAEWFKDNGDGTVTDTQSKLVWQKGDGGWKADAKAYCQGLVLGTKSDWRLPTLFELETIVDYAKASPAVPTAFAGTIAMYYWSLSPYSPSSSHAWVVDFATGRTLFDVEPSYNPRVRCVRSPSNAEAAVGRYKVNAAAKTVYDTVTKLTWQRDGTASGWNMNVAAGDSFCSNLVLDGTGWRLPTIVELQSILDLSKSQVAIDPSAFPDTPTDVWTWSSTKAQNSSSIVWNVHFPSGWSVQYGAESGARVRCVRDTPCVADTDCDDGKACTADSCAAGVCKNTPKPCGTNATCAEQDGLCKCDTGFVGDGQICKCGPQMVAIDVDGKTVCAPDYPAWGIRPESPPPDWFKDNGDGTVTDTQSKLVWQKGDSSDTKDWAGAKGYCQGLVLGAKSDWRLPTRFELETTSDFAKVNPAVPPMIAGAGTYYWSMSPYHDVPSFVWMVNYNTGANDKFHITSKAQVRCVRSLPVAGAPASRYQVSESEKTLYDAVTKLTWQREGSASGKVNWTEAGTYCSTVGLEGTGWRLPTIVEMRSIVDLTKSNPAIDSTAFPSTPIDANTWSSTKVAGSQSQFVWVLHFLSGGGNSDNDLPYNYRVRCVRDAPSAPPGMVLIPAGTFWMGCNATKDGNCSPDEKPQHNVTLSSYFMDLTETTVGQYKACVDAKACTAPSKVQPTQYATYPGLTNNPVNHVSWAQSQAYCKWRGEAYDLPTEAQWEMAARGSCEKNGSTAANAACAAAMRTYPWGEATPTCSYAVMYDPSIGCATNLTGAVGQKSAGDSPYGLHDMAGNVWEWNRDWYDLYAAGAQMDPVGPGNTSIRVARGGGFFYVSGFLRSGDRYYFDPSYAHEVLGLRCVKAVP
jgi:formylglycine-generating enzyme required for sulfatase activity